MILLKSARITLKLWIFRDCRDHARTALKAPSAYFRYTVGCGPFSRVCRSQIMPSRV